jgi:cytochrome c553
MKKCYSVYLVCVVLAMGACTHEMPVAPTDPSNPSGTPGPPSAPATGKPCSSDSVYFSNDILPLITSNCSMKTCHGGSVGPTLTNYSQIKGNQGDILEKITRGEMPIAPVGLLTSAQIALFNKWIHQGSKNNSCTAACDTTKFTYTAVIDPMMKRNCVGCHTGATASNKNVDLSTYSGVKTSALSGQLYKSVAHLPGATAMPPSGTALSTCEITQIKKWIAAGAPN